MDTFLATVLAGVIVALVGAVAAYFFGGRQERRKQEYESQKEEQERQEELQKEQDEYRAQVLTEIKRQASTIVDDVSSWANNILDLDVENAPLILEGQGFLKRLAADYPKERDGRQANGAATRIHKAYAAGRPYLSQDEILKAVL